MLGGLDKHWIGLKEALGVTKTPTCINRDAGSYQLRHTWDQMISRSRAPSSCKQSRRDQDMSFDGVETLSLSNILQLCRVRSFYITVNIVHFCCHYYLDFDSFCLNHSEWWRATPIRCFSNQTKVHSANIAHLVHAKNSSRTRYTAYRFHTLSGSLRRSLQGFLDRPKPVCWHA